MSRWKAASIHFAASILVLLSLAALLAATWFPPRLLWASGGLGLIGILAAVDACLGPLLTLVIFKAGKPGLKFDLVCIAILQVLAMGYGLYTMYWARPAYLVFTGNRFTLATAAEIPEENLAKANREEYRSLPLTGPRLVAAKLPEDGEEANRILFSALGGGADLEGFPQYYVPYEEMRAAIIKEGKPLAELQRKDENTRVTLAAYIDDHDLQAPQLKYLPLRAKVKDQTVLIDAASAEVLGIVDVDPW